MEPLRGTCEPPLENTLGLDAARTVRVPTCRSLCFMWFPRCILSVLAGIACDVSLNPKPWKLRPLSNSWIISIIRLYIALNRTPNIDCGGSTQCFP